MQPFIANATTSLLHAWVKTDICPPPTKWAKHVREPANAGKEMASRYLQTLQQVGWVKRSVAHRHRSPCMMGCGLTASTHPMSLFILIPIATLMLLGGIKAKASEYAVVPAGKTCTKEDASPLQAPPPAIATIKPPHTHDEHANCLITAKTALSLLTHIVIADVRPQRQAERVWIPGAIQISADAISANMLLRKADVALLVGNGKDTPLLLSRCTALRKAAIHAQVLSGGLPAWYRAGGATAGDNLSLNTPLLLNTAEFHQALQISSSLLVFIGVKPFITTHDASTHRLELPEHTTPADGVRSLAKTIADLSVINSAVLVMANADAALSWHDAFLATYRLQPLIFVSNSEHYFAYLDQQKQIAANANKSLRRPCDHP